MIIVPLTVSLSLLLIAALVDPWFGLILHICVEQLLLQIRKFPLMLKLRWDIFWIMRSKRKYLKMAEQIRKSLEVDNEQA